MTSRTIAASIAAASMAVLCLASTAPPAAAHPHVWILAWSDVVFDDQGRIVAINVEWEFDEFYSAFAIEGLDANGDGNYDAGELQALAVENMTSLSEYNYLMDARVDGAAAAFAAATEYGLNYKSPYLSLHFRMPLAEPVDPRIQAFAYRIYDPSFYISIELKDAQAVSIIGQAPEACALRIDTAVGNAAEAEQQPESFYENLLASEDLGSMYADTIVVACKGGSQS